MMRGLQKKSFLLFPKDIIMTFTRHDDSPFQKVSGKCGITSQRKATLSVTYTEDKIHAVSMSALQPIQSTEAQPISESLKTLYSFDFITHFYFLYQSN